MTTQTMSTAENTNLLMAYFDRKMMASLHEEVWFYSLCEKRPLPKNSGTTITFNAWNKFAAPSATLSEYSASATGAVALSSRKVTATIASYGRNIRFGDMIDMTSVLPVEPGALREMEHSAALAVDNVIQYAAFKNVLAQCGQLGDAKTKILSCWLSATASAFCANTGTVHSGSNKQFGFPVVFAASCVLSSVNASAPSISAKLGPIGIRKAVARLKKFAVPTMAGGKYLAVAHPYALTTMFGNPSWQQWHVNFAGGPAESMYKNEVGIVHNVRFLESVNAPRYVGTNYSVNLTLIVGEGALGVTEIDGGIKMIIKRPGPGSTNDPYDMLNTLAYKYRGAAAVLNPSCGVILLSHEKI